MSKCVHGNTCECMHAHKRTPGRGRERERARGTQRVAKKEETVAGMYPTPRTNPKDRNGEQTYT